MSHTHTNTDAMDAHGKHLTGEITSQLDKAKDAAGSVDLGPDVMGVICQVWTGIFRTELEDAQKMLKELPKAVEGTGDKVLKASQEFRDRDEGASNELGRLLG